MHCLRAGLRVVMLLRVRFTVILLMSEINARSSFFSAVLKFFEDFSDAIKFEKGSRFVTVLKWNSFSLI